MQYRPFGDLDYQVSALGFGAMRLPTDEEGNIDEERAIKMIRYALDQGVNYIDTAWPYHGKKSEPLVARALEDGYREQTKIATKLPSWEIETEEDLDKYLNKQLSKLKVDNIDFYLLHALTEERWDKYKEVDVFSWIKKVKQENKIDYIGFSFHDDYGQFEKIVDEYEGWDFCQIQYNYLDTHFQAGHKGMKYAARKGIPVIVMEPLRGGQLAQDPPEEVKKIVQDSGVERTMADLALQWVWDQPEVTTALSGMSNMQQVKENVASAEQSAINHLAEKEKDLVGNIAEKLRGPIQCTQCNYCMPCPTGVQIPRNFALYNRAHVYDDFEENREKYQDLDQSKQAEACVRCGQCEPACPQDLEIMDLLEDVAEFFV